MSSRNLFVSILFACLLMTGLQRLVPEANAASAGHSFHDPAESAKNSLMEIKHRARASRIYLPIVPYIAYDYPYYYSRGFYPTHIGPGYVYHGYPYAHYRRGHGYAGYEAGPRSAKDRCARRFRSFEWETGLYTTYGGHKKPCPYLR